MRINQYVARATGLSRRAADAAISGKRITINGNLAVIGSSVAEGDSVALDNRPITPAVKPLTVMLNKPVGYVCSRDGQGSPTIYDLLPTKYRELKPVGRLDKDSSGLLLLTNDGDLANKLTHPRYDKTKVYEISLDKPLQPDHQKLINNQGVKLEDGNSQLRLKQLGKEGREWQIMMTEGRNRQIRRTFATLGYSITNLNRTSLGDYNLAGLQAGQHTIARS